MVIKRRLSDYLTNTNILVITAGSIFLPYILAGIILLSIAIYVTFSKNTRKLIFIHNDNKILFLFLAYIIMIPLIYGNWLGIIVGLAVILAVFLALFLQSIMTGILYEKALRLVCIMSIAVTSCAIIEKIVIQITGQSYSTQRISAVYLHPNYFGTIVATVIIICAYKVLTRQGQKWFYYTVALLNVVSLYLCESMFAWVEVFLGIAVLLVILKKHRLLAVWFFAAALACFVMFDMDINIIPRLSDVEVTLRIRLRIWNTAIRQIKSEPFFGHGFMSFLFLKQSYYQKKVIPHSHSLFLETLENFGIVGTVLLLRYVVQYYKSVIKLCFKEHKTLITSLILAVTVATLAHGITDITLLWIQTLPLFLIILAGYGVYEKNEL